MSSSSFSGCEAAADVDDLLDMIDTDWDDLKEPEHEPQSCGLTMDYDSTGTLDTNDSDNLNNALCGIFVNTEVDFSNSVSDQFDLDNVQLDVECSSIERIETLADEYVQHLMKMPLEEANVEWWIRELPEEEVKKEKLSPLNTLDDAWNLTPLSPVEFYESHHQLDSSVLLDGFYHSAQSSSSSSTASSPNSTTSEAPSEPVRRQATKKRSPVKRLVKECSAEKCKNRVRSRGRCKAHGGGKKCTFPGCNTCSVGGHFCIRHGGGKKCGFPFCSNVVQSRGMCKSHGGGARCQVAGCRKSSQGGGRCTSHGGGRRCDIPGCVKGAQAKGKCYMHRHR